MTDTAGPFDGTPWAEAQWARHAAVWATSGVYGPPAASTTTGDLPLSVSGLSVGLGAGRAWVRGFGFERTGAAVMQAVTANTHASFSRRDRIVLRRNLATHTLTPVLLTGTPSGSPTPPAISQSETGSWDLPVFSFLAPPASGTGITGIVDERLWVDAGGYLGTLLAYRSGAVQTIPGGTGTVTVVLNAAQQTLAGLTVNPATGEITVADFAGGTYEVSVVNAVREPSAGDSRLFASAFVNGTEVVRGTDSHRRGGAALDQTSSVIPSRRITLAGGDVLTDRVFHDGLTAAELLPGQAIDWLELRRIS